MLSRLLPLLLLFTLPAAVRGDSDAAPKEDVGQHVVRPGESLEMITAHYFGSSERWRENWALNPKVKNPHLILPGMTLKVLLPAKLPEETARLARKSRQVNDRLMPREWLGALENDLLLPRDQVRTLEGASCEIVFPDETSLVLTEQTLVMLGEEEEEVTRVDSQFIRLEVGQADLQTRAGAQAEVEVQLGTAALSRPRPAADGGVVRTRNRVKDDGKGQLMVYEGQSAVEAGGQQVEVEKGMGTSVEPGSVPSPPEKLLDAPEIVVPIAGAQLGAIDVFEWKPVEGAASYVVELCYDPRCGELLVRGTSTTTTWQPPAEVDGDPEWRRVKRSYYWRVTAVSPSGLDGYPSGSLPDGTATGIAFVVTDPPPPAADYQVTWHFTTPKLGVSDRLLTGPGIAIDAEVAPHPHLVRWSRLLDGQPVGEEDWHAPFASGRHTVAVLVEDRFQRKLTAGETPFVYDPDPPEIRWGREGEDEVLGTVRGLVDQTRGRAARTPPPLVWTSSSIRWLPMQSQLWEIQSDEPYIVVRTPQEKKRKKEKTVGFDTLGLDVDPDRGLWIHAVDAGSGVESMTYQVLEMEGTEHLVLEAVDALGNRTRIAWPFASEKRTVQESDRN